MLNHGFVIEQKCYRHVDFRKQSLTQPNYITIECFQGNARLLQYILIN
jgi:hypothetical protein